MIFTKRIARECPGYRLRLPGRGVAVPGSVVHDVTRDPDADRLLIGHPSGVTPARAVAHRVAEYP